MTTLTKQETTTSSSATQAVIGEVEQFLRDAISGMEPESAGSPSRGRPRVLPAFCLWAGLLVCVLRGFSSQLALWRLLSAGNFWFYPRFPISDEAVYKRLSKAGTEPMEELFARISSLLSSRLIPFTQSKLAPFASEVVALDETTLDPVARSLPALRQLPKGASQLLPGKLAGVFDIRRQQWQEIRHISNPNQNEKLLARSLLEAAPRGSLILADLGYFGFAWFDYLTDSGYYWVSRLREKTSYSITHAFFAQADSFDGIIWLGAHRADRAAHAVRLVRFRVGNSTHSYITNVLDPKLLPIAHIAALYARRWDFEMAVNLVKRYLGLHLLWSAKPVVILQQVWAVLTISQILMALRLEIATRAGVDPFEVSLALLVEYMPQFAYTAKDPVEVFVELGRELGFIRPSRRTVIRAPVIPEDELTPLPPGLILVRQSRYANRNCRPRSKTNN
jgi:hypothetical protein